MVVVRLTNGFGNNIFQYVAARLLAEFHNQEVIVICPWEDYYAKGDLQELGIACQSREPTLSQVVYVDDNNYSQQFDKKNNKANFIVRGYFEDYKYYINNLKEIKGWFPILEERGGKDLVIHLRTGDRLLYKSTFEYKLPVEKYLKAVEQFDFNNLHIVTDMPVWDYITAEELDKLIFHVAVPANNRIDSHKAVEYFNSLVEGFSKYNPVIKKQTIVEDFNFIRTFNNILFENGTLGWWAAILSNADRVGVYGPWRPWKGKSNKNLSQVDLESWFKWE
jgi:hypothetical protein